MIVGHYVDLSTAAPPSLWRAVTLILMLRGRSGPFSADSPQYIVCCLDRGQIFRRQPLQAGEGESALGGAIYDMCHGHPFETRHTVRFFGQRAAGIAQIFPRRLRRPAGTICRCSVDRW